MALTIDDIFPCRDRTDRILEPHECVRIPSIPSILTESQSGVVYRRKIGNQVLRYQYKYNEIMRWEYELISRFFDRMQGQYEEFYLVDWTTPFIPVEQPTANSVVFESTIELTNQIGYIGNKLLVYNTLYDPKQAQTDKAILTVYSINNNTVTFSETIPLGLRRTDSKFWILVPAIFETDSLSAEVNARCGDKTVYYAKGYGQVNTFGNIVSINLGFRALATKPIT